MVNRKFVDRTSDSEKDSKVVLHHVPFKVDYDGPANVEEKFTEKTVPSTEDPGVLINQFRGRPLQGQKLSLPENFEGVVLSDLVKSRSSRSREEDSAAANDDIKISVINNFDSLTYWNWDKRPSGMDKHVKLLDWLEISNALHEPIQNTSEDC